MIARVFSASYRPSKFDRKENKHMRATSVRDARKISPVLKRAEKAFKTNHPVPGYVHSLESFTAVDGSGIRYMVFLQGCSMRCVFCSNPDTWNVVSNGVELTHDVLFRQMSKLKTYLIKNGGGITVSGGEPMLQPHFVSALFSLAKEAGLTTCVDTNGRGGDHSWDVVLPVTDKVLFCIKHIDPDVYRDITGMDQNVAMRFAKKLSDTGTAYRLRYVLVPGLTDGDDDLERLADWASKQKTLECVELLPYHRLGVNKWDELGYSYPLYGYSPPSKEDIRRATGILRSRGLHVMV